MKEPGRNSHAGEAPLIERLLNSAANAEELLKGGIDVSGLSDEEFRTLLRSLPVTPD